MFVTCDKLFVNVYTRKLLGNRSQHAALFMIDGYGTGYKSTKVQKSSFDRYYFIFNNKL